MKVYCSHAVKVFHKSSNFYQCRLCPAYWYGGQPIPMMIVGFTEPFEVDSHYMDQYEEKDLSKKNFKRCHICKDLLEKRKHYICALKTRWKLHLERHDEFMANIMLVLRGFKRDK